MHENVITKPHGTMSVDTESVRDMTGISGKVIKDTEKDWV